MIFLWKTYGEWNTFKSFEKQAVAIDNFYAEIGSCDRKLCLCAAIVLVCIPTRFPYRCLNSIWSVYLHDCRILIRGPRCSNFVVLLNLKEYLCVIFSQILLPVIPECAKFAKKYRSSIFKVSAWFHLNAIQHHKGSRITINLFRGINIPINQEIQVTYTIHPHTIWVCDLHFIGMLHKWMICNMRSWVLWQWQGIL